MVDKLIKRLDRSSQVMSSPEISHSSREYNELLNLIAQKNQIIDEVKIACHGRDSVPVSKLKKIIA